MRPLSHSLVVTLALLISISDGLAAQRGKPKRGKAMAASASRIDPYTNADKASLARAGYQSLGPFAWGDGHSSTAIQKMLPAVKLRWLETEHFKIGSALNSYRLPNNKQRRRAIRKELLELQKKLPSVKPKTKVLDPWLRLHLTAHRLETLYAKVRQQLRVNDDDFPRGEGDTQPGSDAVTSSSKDSTYRGRGPFLGMPNKYLVLLLNKKSNLCRYGRFATGAAPNPDYPVVHTFAKTGSLFVGTNTELADSLLQDDHELHCHLIANTVGVLLDGFNYYHYRVPAWLREGLGHWYVQRLDPKARLFRAVKNMDKREKDQLNWGRAVRQLAKHKDYKPAAVLLPQQQPTDFELEDHIASWSRVDFLIRQPERFARLLTRLKTKLPAPSGQVPQWSAVVAQQNIALQEAYGWTPEAFDKAWTDFVLSTKTRR